MISNNSILPVTLHLTYRQLFSKIGILTNLKIHQAQAPKDVSALNYTPASDIIFVFIV